VLVVPHGSSVYAYHLQYAFPNCPLAEFINLSPDASQVTPYFGSVFHDEPLPMDGYIELPDKPGFGVTLNRENLRRPYPRSEKESLAQADRNKAPPPATKAVLPF
jgi:L-rhamnonate dehydratase